MPVRHGSGGRKAALGVCAALAAAAALPAAAPAAVSTSSVPLARTTSLAGAGALGAEGLQGPEFPGGGTAKAEPPVDRSLSSSVAIGPAITASRRAKSNPEVVQSFTGITHRDQRLASGGNQFSLEPPDQGLCAGNGYVLETVNDALRVYDGQGAPLTPTTALNAFYGFKPAVDRATGASGPFVTDPSCVYDAASQRWFHVVLTLDTDPATGAFLGSNHLDLAVSRTADPTGRWSIYSIPVQGDCVDPTHQPCLGDYPHIGTDANGFYITTNSYEFFGDGFDSAWVYAFSKARLAAGDATVRVTRMDTAGLDGGNPGFTLLPAAGSQEVDTSAGGTQYFLSSNAAAEANGTSRSSDVLVWALTNTASLNSAAPALKLSHRTLNAGEYAISPAATQKAGTTPLADCIDDTSCSKLLFGKPFHGPAAQEGVLDTSDTRMLAATYAQGRLWGALDTAVTVGGENRAGILWFVVRPDTSSGTLTATLGVHGYTAMASHDLAFPAIGVTPSGRGVMGFSLSGRDFFPSQGYAGLDALAGAGDIHVAAAGASPQDGFSEYGAFGDPPRPRWGDYAGAFVVGSSVWLANEFSAAPACTLAQYEAAPFGSCGGTRTALANWGTRLSLVTP